MFKNLHPKSEALIENALGMFTVAKDKLAKGVEIAQGEAVVIEAKVRDLSDELKAKVDSSDKAQKVIDNINKFLGD